MVPKGEKNRELLEKTKTLLNFATLNQFASTMKIRFARLQAVLFFLILSTFVASGQETLADADDDSDYSEQTLDEDSLIAEDLALFEEMQEAKKQDEGVYKALKRKFIEGNVGFMSLVALALILGLAFCIERIIYLTLAEVNTRKMLEDIDAKVGAGDIEGAKDIARDTRGPVASICYQGLMRIDENIDSIDRSMGAYGQVQLANL